MGQRGILFELGHELFTPGGNFNLGHVGPPKLVELVLLLVLLVKVKAIRTELPS